MDVHLLEEAIYHKPIALSIQWKSWLHKLIQKIDLESWPKRLGKLDDGRLMRGHLSKDIKLCKLG